MAVSVSVVYPCDGMADGKLWLTAAVQRQENPRRGQNSSTVSTECVITLTLLST